MTTVLLMKAQNPMPIQDLVLADRTHLEESEDEAPKVHPKATNQAFLSKLMQSSHLSDITLSLQLVGQFAQPLAPKITVKLYQVRLKVIIMQIHGVLAPILLWIHTRDRLAMSLVTTRKLIIQKYALVQGSLYGLTRLKANCIYFKLTSDQICEKFQAIPFKTLINVDRSVYPSVMMHRMKTDPLEYNLKTQNYRSLSK